MTTAASRPSTAARLMPQIPAVQKLWETSPTFALKEVTAAGPVCLEDRVPLFCASGGQRQCRASGRRRQDVRPTVHQVVILGIKHQRQEDTAKGS